MITFDQSPQGSVEWLAIRRGCITGSRFRDALDRLKGGTPSKACRSYAMDVARERVGGTVAPTFVNAAMRTGTTEEPRARLAYEELTGNVVLEAGFAYTADRLFGASVDGLVGSDGVIEIKTMVSSDTLFTAVIDGDISAYTDQCNGAMWLLGRMWVDLILWAPDLEGIGRHLTIHRIKRDDNVIEALEEDLMAFAGMVARHAYALTGDAAHIADRAGSVPPWEVTSPAAAAPLKPKAALAALPDDIFA